jgi:hypothetical protein
VASHKMRKMLQELLLVTSTRYCQTKSKNNLGVS